MEPVFNHFDQAGNAVMVDVTGKEPTYRTAVAEGKIFVTRPILDAITGRTAAKGDVLGVAIAPGVALSLDALVDRASHLHAIAFEPPGPAIGTTTAESMQSGVIYGAACLVDGMFRRMAAEMDTSEGAPSLILTGGLAPLVVPYCETKPLLAPDLLLEGLCRCYLRAKGEDSGWGGQR